MEKAYSSQQNIEQTIDFQRFTKTTLIVFSIWTIFYFAWFGLVVGLDAFSIFFYIVSFALYFGSNITRKFLYAFFILMIYGLIYDALRLKPNYTVNPIHIEDIYNLEKSLFGINTEGGRLTLNEYANLNGNTFLDILSGFFYINWVPIPFGFAFILFFLKRRDIAIKFAYAFFFINIIGFIIYYTFPAAPPWYIEKYGFIVLHNTGSSPAGLINFDNFFGIKLFSNLYQKNSNVFAAMPSMHSAFPLLCFLIGLSLKKRWLNIFFGIFVIGIWFSAVYTRHHYVLDVLAGATVALIGFYLFEYISEKTILKRWFDKLNTIVA